MSELGGKRKYVRLSEGPILVRPNQQRLMRAESNHRGDGINQLTRELIEFGRAFGFFSPEALRSENFPNQQ